MAKNKLYILCTTIYNNILSISLNYIKMYMAWYKACIGKSNICHAISIASPFLSTRPLNEHILSKWVYDTLTILLRIRKIIFKGQPLSYL